MVLGFILYETVDLGVNVVKIGYNSVRGIYYWWYDMDYPEVEREKQAIKDMEILAQRIKELENTLHSEQTNTKLLKN